MNIDNLLDRAVKTEPPSSLKKKVMEKIANMEQDEEYAPLPAGASPRRPSATTFGGKTGFIAAAFASAAALVIAIRMIVPAPEISETDRLELKLFVEKTVASSVSEEESGVYGVRMENSDISQFVNDTLEDVFKFKGEENSA